MVEGPRCRPRRRHGGADMGPDPARGRPVVLRRRDARLRHAEHRLARPVADRADRHRVARPRPRDDPAPDVSEAAPATMADEPAAADRLDLADWRRRVSDLYGEVRRQAARDPERAWRLWRETRESLFRTHPQSPVPQGARDAFRARHWAYDSRYRFEANLAPDATDAGLT